MSAAYERAGFLIERGRYPEAAKELRGLLAEDPDDGGAHAMLALCHAQLKRPDEAIAEARRGVHLEPDRPFTHYILAVVHLDRGESSEALAAIREAVRLDPEDADYFSVLGNIHFARREWHESLAAAREGLRIDPENAGCSNTKSMALRKLGRRGAAAHELKSQLARDPLDADTHANRGWQLLEEGDPRQAALAFREALRLDPENEWAREGIVEAIKARNPIYRVLLKYMFFMSRQSDRMRWGIIIGGYLLYRGMRWLSGSHPDLAPWLMPLIVGYVVFAVLSWIGDPFFNLLLRLHPLGRYALSKEQVQASNTIGILLGFVFTCALVWFLAIGPIRNAAFWIGIFSLCIMLPVAGYFSCTGRAGRRAIGALILGHAVLGLAGILAWNSDLFGAVALIWLVVAVAGPWFVNYQLGRR